MFRFEEVVVWILVRGGKRYVILFLCFIVVLVVFVGFLSFVGILVLSLINDANVGFFDGCFFFEGYTGVFRYSLRFYIVFVCFVVEIMRF